MQIKKLIYAVIIVTFCLSCSKDNDVTIQRNLEDYIASEILDTEDVIACAANAEANNSLTYIFYYPEIGATDIRIYETENITVDENDFKNYTQRSYTIEAVFGGKLERFNRDLNTESWCIVTYLMEDKLRTSNPIKLKNTSKPTEWTDDVIIDHSDMLQPKFTWFDGTYTDNVIYFQVLSETDATFISGTYTTEKTFQFYNLTNVVLNINEAIIPNSLVLGTQYNFTMMGVSEDNWVNLVLQKPFVAQ